MQTYHESLHIALFNVVFTSLPIMMLAGFDQDVSPAVMEKNPGLYKKVQSGADFSFGRFGLWIVDAVYQSLVYFFVPLIAMGLWSSSVLEQGRVLHDMWTLGTVSYSCIIIGVNIKIAIETKCVQDTGKDRFCSDWGVLLQVLDHVEPHRHVGLNCRMVCD